MVINHALVEYNIIIAYSVKKTTLIMFVRKLLVELKNELSI